MPNPAIPLSVLLLAGGRGQRMAGQDKGLVNWQGKAMVSWVHDVVRSITDDLIISCNRNTQLYSVFADRLLNDDENTFEGPLAGIRVGLRNAKHPHLLVLPCDVPQVDAELVHEIISLAGDKPVMVRQGEMLEPLFCLIPTCLYTHLEEAWQAGERSPQHWLLKHAPVFVCCPPNDPRLANFNTPESLLEQD
jgi:molybdopterin-guanine dinucleotide biosynthesis protein A